MILEAMLSCVGLPTISAVEGWLVASLVVLHHVPQPVAVGDNILTKITPPLLGTGGE